MCYKDRPILKRFWNALKSNLRKSNLFSTESKRLIVLSIWIILFRRRGSIDHARADLQDHVVDHGATEDVHPVDQDLDPDQDQAAGLGPRR